MKNSGIEYLLHILDISPSNMAKFINVDRSLISKWKNGQRKISKTSEYFEDILDYLILTDKLQNKFLLESLIKEVYHVDVITTDNLKEYLSLFIHKNHSMKENQKKKNSMIATTVSVNIYDGEQNKKRAILDFLNMSIELHTKNKITAIYSGVFDYYMKDKNFRKKWLNKVLKLLNSDHQFDLILSSYQHSKLFIYFSKIMVHPNFRIYYFTYLNRLSNKFSIHLLENSMVLYGYMGKYKNKFVNSSSLYSDPLSLDMHSAYVYQIKKNSFLATFVKDQSYFINSQNYDNLYYDNKNLYSLNSTIYYIDSIPYYLFINEKLFTEILHQTYTKKTDIMGELKRYRQKKAEFLHTLESTTIIHFYSLQTLHEKAKSCQVSYGTMNTIAHPPLQLTNAQYIEHLRDTAQFLQEHSNMQICLIDDEEFTNDDTIHCFCKRNQLLCLYDKNDPNKVILSEEMTFVNIIADSLEQYYQFSSEDQKSKSYIANILVNLK